MELWIWLIALGLGLMTLLFALARLSVGGVKLAKKLNPFAIHLARFRQDAKLYPEAVKFYSALANTQETPAKKPRSPKANEK
jgi:hypothetical protein